MKRNYLMISILFFSTILVSQNIGFDSYNFWRGDKLNFKWQKDQINLNVVGKGQSLVYFESDWEKETIFEFEIKMPFSPSLNNQFELLLASDSMFTSNVVSVRIGESGTKDGIDVFANNVLMLHNSMRSWGKGGEGLIEIRTKGDSLVFLENFGLGSKHEIGCLYFSNFPEFLGLKTTYTQSNATKFQFRNLFFGIPLKDTVPPGISNLKIESPGVVEVVFDEKVILDQLSFAPYPDSTLLQDSSVLLFYAVQNEDFTVVIEDTVWDMHSNFMMIDTAITLNFLQRYDLIFTEVMSDPDPLLTSYTEEYIELFNRSGFPLSINNVILGIDGVTELLPDTTLEVGAYFVFHPKQTLLNAGSKLELSYSGETIHGIYPNLEWYHNSYKEKGGWSIEMIDFSVPCINEENWLVSDNDNGGTPGFVNSVSRSLDEIPNFEFEHVFPSTDTTIELIFNYDLVALPQPISVTIDGLNIEKVDIDKNILNLKTSTIVADSVYSLQVSSSLHSCWNFGVIDSVSVDFGLPNKPDINDLIITEILVNPDDFGSDFIEIVNNSNDYFNLKKLQFASRNANDEIADIHFCSKTDRLIGPSEMIAFTEDIHWVKAQFDSYGKILNAALPACNNDEDDLILINHTGQLIDELNYSENWHYTELISTENISLEKLNIEGDNIARNWFSASSSSGYGTPGLKNSNTKEQKLHSEVFTIASDVISPNNDGIDDLLLVDINLKNQGWTGSVKIINSEGITIHILYDNLLFGINDQLIWNCKKVDNSILTAGVYVLYFDLLNLEMGDKLNKKITFYINRENL